MSQSTHHPAIELCGCIPGHRVDRLLSICIDCGMSEEDACNAGNRPCNASNSQ